jgi:hypothetical protein
VGVGGGACTASQDGSLLRGWVTPHRMEKVHERALATSRSVTLPEIWSSAGTTRWCSRWSRHSGLCAASQPSANTPYTRNTTCTS